MNESEPTRTGPLIAVGLSQLLFLGLIISLVGAAFQSALSMGGSGQRGEGAGEAFLVCMGFTPLVGAALYTAWDAGHARPVIRAVIGIVVYFVTVLASALIFLPVDEGMLLVAPMLAVGTMLAVLLPTTSTVWTIARIGLPSLAGVVIVMVMSVLTAIRDVPFEWWLWALTAACVLGLGAIRVVEAFRPEIDPSTSSSS
jgi:hypothetical protein